MKLTLRYDEDIDAWTMSHGDVHIGGEDDVLEWLKLVRRELARLRGQRVYLLVDVGGMAIEPVMAESYRRVIKDAVMPHALGIVRYGVANSLTSATIRLSAIKNRYPSYLFPDRAAALEALAYIRALAQRAAS